MSTRTIVELIDDLDGTPATETITFSLDGKEYEIDLNDDHARGLRSLVSPWAEHARKVSSTPSRARSRSGKDYDPAKVRAWARSQGIEVSARGRLDQGIIIAYKAGHAS